MNAFYFTQRTAARFFAVVAMFSLVAGMVPAQAFADQDNEQNQEQNNNQENNEHNDNDDESGNSKITICHYDDGTYNSITIAVSGLNGHSNHANDIIPPTDNDGHSVTSKNWDAEGQAIYNDGKCDGTYVPPVPCPEGTVGDFEPNCTPVVPPIVVNGCTNPDATNYNADATKGNSDAEKCDMNYVSQCGENPNLLTNGSFEDNVGLTNGNWGIFNPVLGWAISNDGLEIWNHLLTTPSNGDQNAELDGNSPSTISQTVTTIPGATYELRFDFAARSDASSAADNHIKATVDGATVVDQSTTNTKWTTYGGTFVADGSTDVSLADLGTPNSLGTLVDNAVLCLVREPVVDYCPNIEGNQTADEGYSKDVNNNCYRPISSCSVDVVSDTSNTVGESGALLVTPNPAWVQTITDSAAQWIWGSPSDSTIDPVNDETQTFTKTFVWSGTPSTALLTLAADNGYSVKLNGTVIGGNSGEFNYSSLATVTDITDNLIQGVNTLEISVTNKANGQTSWTSNPAGLLYDLKITTTDGECGSGGGSNDTPHYRLQGYVWHDNNENQIWDGHNSEDESVPEEAPLEGWTVTATNGDQTFTTSTDATGQYHIDVPAGTWTITETLPFGWGHTNQESYVVTVPAPETMTLLDTVKNFIVPTAFAASIPVTPVYGDYNFGNNERPTGGGGSVRHGNSSGGGSSDNSTPNGEVLGASTSNEAPKGEVLGAQVAAVPAGAPNTGAGGTSPFAAGYIQVVPAAFLRRTKVHG